MTAPAIPSAADRAAQFALGVRLCVPVGISVGAFGLVWGVLARQTGMTLGEAMLMSVTVFAGSAQFVALDLWTPDPSALPIAALVGAALVINLRYLLLTATLRPLFARTGPWRSAGAMFFVSDENWAVTVGQMAEGRGSAAFLLGGGVLIWSVWLATITCGWLLGGAIADPERFGLDFAFTATFLALLLGMWRGRASLLPWVVAALVAALVSQAVGGHWHIIAGGLAGSFCGALAERRPGAAP